MEVFCLCAIEDANEGLWVYFESIWLEGISKLVQLRWFVVGCLRAEVDDLYDALSRNIPVATHLV